MVASKNDTAASILEREPKPSDEIEGEDDMVPVGCLVTFPIFQETVQMFEPKKTMLSPTSGSHKWVAIKSEPRKEDFPRNTSVDLVDIPAACQACLPCFSSGFRDITTTMDVYAKDRDLPKVQVVLGNYAKTLEFGPEKVGKGNPAEIMEG